MLDLVSVILFWFPIVEFDIILLNGVVLIHGLSGIFIAFIIFILSDYRPANREELFNLRHASARNVVERVFGVLKKRWAILTRPPQFNISIQVQVPPGLAAVHNFIMDTDPHDLDHYLNGDADDFDPNPGQPQENEFGTLAASAVTRTEKERATRERDNIGQAMWDDYQRVIRERDQGL